MKKISQAIIVATLILDVAVIFTFGLAVISSFEDGSRLPETTFVRKPVEGRVAGETTSACPTNSNLMIFSPSEGASINTGNFRISIRASGGSSVTTSTLMYVVYPIRVAPFYSKIPTTQQLIIGNEAYAFPYNTEWIADISLTGMQIQRDSFTFHAEGYSSTIGNCIAKSSDRNIIINFTSPVPTVNLASPTAGTISGTKDISGTLSNFSTSYSMPTKELQVWQGMTLKKNLPLTRNNDTLTGSANTAEIADGDYTLKIRLVYNDGTLTGKTLESAPVSVTVNNTNVSGNSATTLPTPSVVLNNPSGGTISGTASIAGTLSNFPSSYSLPIKELQVWQGMTLKKNLPLTRNNDALTGSANTAEIADGDYTLKIRLVYNDGTLTGKTLESAPVSVTVNNVNTAGSDALTDTSSTSDTSMDSTASTTDNTLTGTNGSTDTTTPPLAGTNTATTLTVAMINPAPSTIPTILRSRDNSLAAKTSAAVSGLKFIVHKSGEPADWITPITAELTDGINWKANMNLTVFKDGAYNIAAVSGDIKSESVNVIVQRFSSKWFTPNKGDELAKKAVLRTEINGIYEITDKIPLKDIVVEFWQVGVTSSYPPKYIGRAQKRPDSHEWFYEWNTADSPLGECRLELRIGNAAYSTTKGSLYNTEPLLVKVSNQTSSASLSGSSNSNANQNSNTPSSVNSNTANVNKAANNAINSSTNFNQNTNTAAASNSNLNSAQGASNINSAVVDAVPTQTDSDNDKLSDEKEVLSGTNPNSNDSDGDGLFDHEEVEDHGTNPLNVDTDGDGYNDFEEIQSGHDPLVKPTDPTAAVLVKSKPIEEPKNSQKPVLESLVVEEIENKEAVEIAAPPAAGTDSPSPTPDTTNVIVLKGKGPANTILTLFIYSEDPIVVTVHTNENGEWIYELDKTLEDGEHEVYATITDDTGKIESTSSPMRFLVKQAQAETIPERADTGANSIPGSSSTNLYLLISGIMVFVAIVVGFIIALKRKRGDTNQIT